VLHERRPDLSFASLDGEVIDFEDLIFCHLLTEAVAVAGLDYWYLSCVELNDVVDLGTTVRNLTIPYHERQRAEVRRFCPSLEVQTPEFFVTPHTRRASGHPAPSALASRPRPPPPKRRLNVLGAAGFAVGRDVDRRVGRT
jgi:hypothetical protein